MTLNDRKGRAQLDRGGRGQLSSIDELPDEAEPHIVWALEQLRERKLKQNIILMEFNERLADVAHEHDIEIKPISKSSFNRFSVKKARLFRRLDEVQRMGSELASSMGAEEPDQVTIAVAELLKVAAFEVLEGGEVSTKQIMELSRALQSAVGAQEKSAQYRERLQKEVSAKLAEAAAKVGAIGEKAGVSEEAMTKIKLAFAGQA